MRHPPAVRLPGGPLPKVLSPVGRRGGGAAEDHGGNAEEGELQFGTYGKFKVARKNFLGNCFLKLSLPNHRRPPPSLRRGGGSTTMPGPSKKAHCCENPLPWFSRRHRHLFSPFFCFKIIWRQLALHPPPPGSRRRRHTALLGLHFWQFSNNKKLRVSAGKIFFLSGKKRKFYLVTLIFFHPSYLSHLDLFATRGDPSRTDRLFLPHFLGCGGVVHFLPYLFSSVCFAKTGPPERKFRNICNVAHNNSKFPVLYRSGGKKSLVLFSFV